MLEGLSMRIFVSSWFQKFLTKHHISTDQLIIAVKMMESGRVDAALGGGVFKQRIARPGLGKSAGIRSIIFYRKSERAFFMFAFLKNELVNIESNELVQFKKSAQHVLSLSNKDLAKLLINGVFSEISNHGEKISK